MEQHVRCASGRRGSGDHQQDRWRSDADTHLLGIGLCLAGALSYGFAALWGRRHLRNVPPLKAAACQLLSSTMIMIVIVSVVDRPWTLPPPSAGTWLALVGLALFGTAIAYLVFFEILARAGGSNVMLVTLLLPVTALLLGNLFLNEPIFIQQLIGAATIGLGLLFNPSEWYTPSQADGHCFQKLTETAPSEQEMHASGLSFVERPPPSHRNIRTPERRPVSGACLRAFTFDSRRALEHKKSASRGFSHSRPRRLRAICARRPSAPHREAERRGGVQGDKQSFGGHGVSPVQGMGFHCTCCLPSISR